MLLIEDIKVSYREIPLHTPFKTALRTATEIESITVTIHLANGVIGKGEAAPTWVITGDSAQSIQAALEGPIKTALFHQDIRHFQTLLTAIQNSCVGNTSAKAAADMALYDAYSKWLAIPLYQLLGDHQPIYTSMTVGVDDPAKMADDAKKWVEAGYSRLKIKVGAKPELDITRITAIREAIPADVLLRLDANQGWQPKQAVQLIQKMEKIGAGIEFIEQPVKAKDLDGLKFVTDHVHTPIMADESVFSPQDAFTIVSGHYADLLNIKLMKCGGIQNALSIANLAMVHRMPCMIGSMMESSFSVGAAAHFAAAHPNVIYYDLDAPLWLVEEAEVIDYQGEKLYLSSSAGIGAVNESEK
ncbi:L-Ala-D/L-Glu epimerase [Virgibacillus salexigens]|uniref:Dipeptide epimerase n=1 Tax=Virgibacillus massiliensis TaxID=1462526 RepID=A0A024Q7S4_9BACI|nr:L-Ala-D/L-Glu epimerase [Virgibacillus massiliensis]